MRSNLVRPSVACTLLHPASASGCAHVGPVHVFIIADVD